MNSDLSVKHEQSTRNTNSTQYSKIKSQYEGRVYNATTMSCEEQKEKDTLIKSYIETSESLLNIEKNKTLLEERLTYLIKQKQELNDDKSFIIKIFEKIVFKSIENTIINFSKYNLTTINYDANENKIITNEEGIREVILPLAKEYSLKEIDLTPFKDKIMGKALEIFLMDVPNTQIKKIAISAKKLTCLSAEEKKLFVALKSQGIALIAKT